MAEYLIQDSTLEDIADAIRAKTGGTNTMTPAQMAAAIAAISGKETLSWHQCPEAVRNYLAYVAEHPYDPNDHSTTAILDFAPNPADQSNTKPVGFTVDGVTFRDNEPLIATPFATQNKAGTLTALDRLRWYNTTEGSASGNVYPRGRNCRDLGGWACDGGTVKYGMLVRSGELNAADKERMVDQVGIKTEINLLPLSEQATDRSVWGIDRVANPTDRDIQYGLTETDQWKLYLKTIFQSVAAGRPVIFHCGVGADKTGTLAVMLLGILGCSLSDIDTDFELTAFTHWTNWRNRTRAGYVDYINAIRSVPLAGGLTDSFQNRCISFALSLGITADGINAFRAACIDGTPERINPILAARTVTKTLSHVTADNPEERVTQYQPYEVNVLADEGYAISDVSVTMGGADVTGQVFRGTGALLRRAVTNALTNCATDNAKKSVINGEGYGATITADNGYTLAGATVNITMGGTDVSSYYSDGKIAIPSVTGDLVITVSAVPSAPAYTNLADPADPYWKDGYRLSISSGGTSVLAGHTTTNFIPAKPGDVLRVKGMKLTSAESSTGSNCKIVVYTAKDDESSHVDGLYGTTSTQKRHAYGSRVTVSGDVSAYTLLYDNNGTQTSATAMQYFRIDGILLSGYTADDVVITVNEEID